MPQGCLIAPSFWPGSLLFVSLPPLSTFFPVRHNATILGFRPDTCDHELCTSPSQVLPLSYMFKILNAHTAARSKAGLMRLFSLLSESWTSGFGNQCKVDSALDFI